MKKTIKFFAAALAIVAAAACAKENPDSQLSERQEYTYELEDKTFNASFESPNSSTTKTTLANDGLTVYWEQGDQIAPFPYGGTGQYDKCPYDAYDNPWNKIYWQMTVTQNSGTSALFEGTVGSCSKYGAIYPYDSINHADCYGSVYTFKSIANQNVKPNDFPTTEWGVANISLALDHTADNVFKFKNCLAYIKFEIGETDDPIYSIEVSAEEVTTYVSYTSAPNQTTSSNVGSELYYMTAHKKYCMNKNNDKPITVTNGDNAFEVGKIYYIAIPAITMNGFSLTCKDINDNVVIGKNRQSQFIAESNNIYNIGVLGSTTSGVDVQINPIAEAVHKTDANGTIIGTDVTFYVQPTNASEIKDFTLKATLDDYRSYSTTNPNASGVMTVLNDNKYLPRGEKGYYFINCEYTVNGYKHTQSVRVNIPKPVFSSSTEFTNSYSHYCNGYIDAANQMDAGTLQINRSSATINYDIVSLHPITFEVEINGQTFKVENSKYSTTNWGKELTSVPAGKYSLKTRVTFDGITRESEQDVYMTGLPMKSFNASDWSWPGIAPTLNVNKKAELTGITVPEGKSININVNAAAELWGYNADTYIVYTINLGNNSYTGTTQGHSYSNKQYTLNNGTGTITSSQHITMTTGCNYAMDNMRIILNKFEAYYR